MKNKLLIVLAGITLFLIPRVNYGQSAPTLGTAANFVLFTTNGAMTNSGIPHLTHLTGNVGSNLAAAISGFGNVDGVMHDFDVASGACVPDVLSLYSQLNGATPTATLSSTLGGGTTLNHGVYKILTATTLGGSLNLDALGDPSAVFIFQIQGPLSTNTLSKVNLVNGALACNVFWKVEGLVSMASGTTMRGTLVANNAAINMGSLDTLEGRALSINGAVTVTEILAYMPLGCGSAVLTGPGAPTLVASAPFAVFSSIGSVTSTPVTYVVGDVGSNSTVTTGFVPLNVTGTIHPIPDAATAAAAGDLTNVYNYLNGLSADIDLLDPANFGFNLVLTPHTYLLTPATLLNDTLFLNAEGDANAVFVIKINGAFTTTVSSYVRLINGTQSKNVYWLINGAVHIYDNSVFNGTLVVAGAITLNTGDTLNGRALSINGAVAVNGSFVDNNPIVTCRAPAIGGTFHVCTGGLTTLTDSTTGGTWSSSNISNATVGSSSGIVTGITPGTSIIQYATTAGCVNTATMTVNSSPNAITGQGNLCIGSSITLTDTATGGSWTSSNPSSASVGTVSGIVMGVSAGTPTITYTLSTSCYAFKTLTVSAFHGAGNIAGPSGCIGSSFLLTDSVSGGTWTSNNALVATAGTGTGIVTGVSAGTCLISYEVIGACGTAFATKTITITTSATAGTISGPSTVCVGSPIPLASTISGGTWASSNSADASVGSISGIVTGVALGTAIITYKVTGSCGAAIAMTTVSISPSLNAGTIMGNAPICPSGSITLSDAAGSGVWTSVDQATATIGSSSGFVMGVAPGSSIISYTVTNSCGTAAATVVVAVNTSINAGTIAGNAPICPSGNDTLSDAVSGGLWTSGNPATATIGSSSGIATGVALGTTIISYKVTNSCGSASATAVLAVTTSTTAGSITGNAPICPSGNLTLRDAVSGGFWTSGNPATATIGSSSGIATGVALGTTIISYKVTNSCGSASATAVLAVTTSANAGSITGNAPICPSGNITLSDAVGGGVWTSVNTAAVRVGSLSGSVTGVAPGTSTISYTVTNSCGTAAATTVVTVNTSSVVGGITGLSTVCVGLNDTLSDVTSGGVWSSSSPSTASIPASSGVATGHLSGMVIINYTVTSGCGTAIATATLNVQTLPDAGIITGLSNVCVGSPISLTESVTGTWSSSNTSASVSPTGIVTGVVTGIDTVIFTVTNVCGNSIAAPKMVAVNEAPTAAPAGNGPLCLGGTLNLTPSAGGGTGTILYAWGGPGLSSTTGANPTAVPMVTGANTYSLIVTSSGCSSMPYNTTVTVNLVPVAVPSSNSPLCLGGTVSLSSSAIGGTGRLLYAWSGADLSSTIIANPTALPTVTGTNVYSLSVSSTGSGCNSGIAYTTMVVVNAVPTAVPSSSSPLCLGGTVNLISSATGGTGTILYNWRRADLSSAIIANPTAVPTVTGVSVYSLTVSSTGSGCNTGVVYTTTVSVNPVPVASPSTNSPLCLGGTVNLISSASGGTGAILFNWSGADLSSTIATNPTALPSVTGVSVYSLSVSSTGSGCNSGVVYTTSVTVDPVPVASPFSNSPICLGGTLNLTSSASGGTGAIVYNWRGADLSSTIIANPTALPTVTGTSVYSLTVSSTGSGCISGMIYTTLVTVDPVPVASPTNNSPVCLGGIVILTSSASGGTGTIQYDWSGADLSTATMANPTATPTVNGMSIYSLTVSSMGSGCNSGVIYTTTVTINPLPDAGTITGNPVVCVGSTSLLTDDVTGGSWSSQNILANVSGGLITGVTAGGDVISYSVTNGCGTAIATKTITINLLPMVPVITTEGPSTACTGTMYQNYGTSIPPPANTTYNWTATNATVWAEGSLHQYALVNFDETGFANVTLNVTTQGTTCVSKSTLTVNVGTAEAQVATVYYFNNNFVCSPSNLDSYQWGYDNVVTLDSSLFPGEINEDYVNTNPDFTNKYYWVMTTSGSCLQKTYYTVPLEVQNINSEVVLSVYPNPASSILTLALSGIENGNVVVVVSNMMGQKVNTVEVINNKAAIDVTAFVSGSYIINCYRDGVNVAHTKFVKN